MARIRKRRRKPGRGGRPSKYSAEVARRICRAVAQGSSREAAAGLGGISKDTLYAWVRENQKFSHLLEKADSRFEAECVRNIRQAGKSKRNWTASAWMLERKHPARWGRIDRHLVRTEGDAKMPMPREYVDAIRRALGMTGKLVPIHKPNSLDSLVIDVEAEEIPALPEPSVAYLDSGELAVLPEPDPNAPVQ